MRAVLDIVLIILDLYVWLLIASAILNVSAADVALQGYQGLMANKRTVFPGLGIKIVPLLLRLFPRGFIAGAVARLQLRRV